jgi:hypothetical protein
LIPDEVSSHKSGIEVARQAAAMRPSLKVLLTSGYPEEVFQHHGGPGEGIPLLRKPCRRNELPAKLK